MYHSSTAIFISWGMSLVCVIIYIYLMSAFAEPLAWLMIAGTQIGLYGASAMCFYQRSIVTVESSKTQFLWIGVSFAVVGFGFSACVICGFKSLK
jgi:hypothetical protein